MATKSTSPGQGETDRAAGELTSALENLREGAPGALERVVPMLYDELRSMARQRLRSERQWHTLGTTGLVHEAYLRLLQQRRLSVENRSEFLAAASNTMRRLLVDYARTRNRQKRGGGVEPVALEKVEPFLSDRASVEMVELDDALARLSDRMPRAARIFELCTFGGLELREIAEVEDLSSKTVQRDLAAARAWLRKEVRGRTVAEGPTSLGRDQGTSR